MITIKRGDTGIGLEATLENEIGRVDITGANVVFLMGEHTIFPEVIDAENGNILIVFEREHTESAGLFDAEVKVRFLDGRIETYPDEGFLQIKITKDLGGR